MSRGDEERSIMTAVTFAEEGEWETARRYAPPGRPGALRAWIERHLAAIAFAEEGLFDEALRTAGAALPVPAPRPHEEDALDALLLARGVRMFCGVLSPAALGARR